MASQKQIAANRKNAKKSTGPRTQAGKSITRLNAKRDGFTGQVITLSEEDRPVFENFKSQFIKDLAPKTTMELSLANSIAWDTWRLNRLRAVEMNMYALGTDNLSDLGPGAENNNPQVATALAAAATFAKESQKFALMSIYEQRMNRGIHKNLETLRKLQAERKANHEKDRAEEIILARYSDIKGLTYNAPTTPTASGSLFTNREILTAANRLTTLEVAAHEVCLAPLKVHFAGAASAAPGNIRYWPNNDAA